MQLRTQQPKHCIRPVCPNMFWFCKRARKLRECASTARPEAVALRQQETVPRPAPPSLNVNALLGNTMVTIPNSKSAF